jgi:MFS family permease
MTDSPDPDTVTTQIGKRLEMIVQVLPFLFGVAVMAFVIEPVRAFIFEWRGVFVPLLMFTAILVLIALLMPAGQRWLNESKPTTRAALLIFVVLPSLVLVVGSVAVLGKFFQFTALRAVFLTVVCLMPAAMWYLFLVTRKASLLNEFLANLHRLGLLREANNEDTANRGRRVQSYLQKFEAIYGDLPQNIHDDVLGNRLGQYSRADTGGVTTLSTATVPVMLSTILIALGWFVTLPPYEAGAVIDRSPGVQALALAGTPVQLAFLGAYFFSLQMLFRRYVLEDLGGSAYVAVSIRIILAVIAIWVLMAVGGLDEKYLLVAGFVFGVFPRILWQIVGSIFKKIAGIIVPSMISQLPVSDLDGLTVWHEARLEEEDIENIPNMATADLVELLLNTRLPPERIIDWTDQAILYTQLGPQENKKGELNARQKLRVHGIRTATSLLWSSAEAQRQEKSESFDKILTDFEGNSAMPTLQASLTTNSNLDLVQLWRNTSDAPQRPALPMQIQPDDSKDRKVLVSQILPSANAD